VGVEAGFIILNLKKETVNGKVARTFIFSKQEPNAFLFVTVLLVLSAVSGIKEKVPSLTESM
jgi:hypothetical protein